LGADYLVAVVDDEGRYPADAVRLGAHHRLVDPFRVLRIFQRGDRSIWIEPGLGGDFSKDVDVGQVPPLDEVHLKKPPVHWIHLPRVSSILGEKQRGARVVELRRGVHRQSDARRAFLKGFVHRPDRLHRPAGVLLETDPLLRRARVELKRQPDDVQVDVRFLLELVDETRADVAERSDVVGEDLDGDRDSWHGPTLACLALFGLV
jgi:hypothetical protein